MDHETRELLSNIIGLLEIMKKDIKGIKHDIGVLNSRPEESNPVHKVPDGCRQQIKVLAVQNTIPSTFTDQLKMSRLK